MIRAVVVGEKVYFRPIEREDIDRGWYDWVNDPEVVNIRENVLPITRDDLVRYLESQGHDSLMFAICAKDSDDYVGNIRLSTIDWIHRSAGYGRLIGAPYRGSGYGTDSLLLLFRYGFRYLGLNRLWTQVWSDNTASLASNEKLGVMREGVLRQAFYKDGTYSDAICLAMLREDFERLYGGPGTAEK